MKTFITIKNRISNIYQQFRISGIFFQTLFDGNKSMSLEEMYCISTYFMTPGGAIIKDEE